MATCLITGASRGIGEEMTRRLVARGDRVLAASRAGAAPCEGAEAVTLDVCDDAELAALTQRLEGEALDLLICNAGALVARGGLDDPENTRAGWDDVLAVNVTGVFMTIQAALPAIRRGKGKIAVISSQMGSNERAKANAFLYRASKAAATNLVQSIGEALRPEGIPVGAYHPGWVRTDMGGSAADISVEESAAGLIQRFDALSMETTRCFEFYSGERIPF